MCVGEVIITYFLKYVILFVHTILMAIKWSDNEVRNTMTGNFLPIVNIWLWTQAVQAYILWDGLALL